MVCTRWCSEAWKRTREKAGHEGHRRVDGEWTEPAGVKQDRGVRPKARADQPPPSRVHVGRKGWGSAPRDPRNQLPAEGRGQAPRGPLLQLHPRQNQEPSRIRVAASRLVGDPGCPGPARSRARPAGGCSQARGEHSQPLLRLLIPPLRLGVGAGALQGSAGGGRFQGQRPSRPSPQKPISSPAVPIGRLPRA